MLSWIAFFYYLFVTQCHWKFISVPKQQLWIPERKLKQVFSPDISGHSIACCITLCQRKNKTSHHNCQNSRKLWLLSLKEPFVCNKSFKWYKICCLICVHWKGCRNSKIWLKAVTRILHHKHKNSHHSHWKHHVIQGTQNLLLNMCWLERVQKLKDLTKSRHSHSAP